mmetsp:Transcript_9877/g.21448  ORF Transcript_9877/g.21448 Transcript_9877/m.21448 type:complete len:427 (-) Transcript_9877:2067-3347(-)
MSEATTPTKMAEQQPSGTATKDPLSKEGEAATGTNQNDDDNSDKAGNTSISNDNGDDDEEQQRQQEQQREGTADEFRDEHEDEEDDENHDETQALSQSNNSSNDNSNNINNNNNESSSRRWWWFRCALPDDAPTLYGHALLEGPFAVKWLKFVGVTLLGICFMHWFIRQMVRGTAFIFAFGFLSSVPRLSPYDNGNVLVWLLLYSSSLLRFAYHQPPQNWEHRQNYTLQQFYTYESTMTVVDATVFFTVARLHRQRGVDHVAFLTVLFAATFYASYVTTFSFLQHSFTLYEMHCRWPPALWIFVAILIPLIVTIILWHVRYAVRTGVFVSKFMELVLAVVLLVAPYATSPYLHLHHWYVGWLAGMHANFDVWWSRATLACASTPGHCRLWPRPRANVRVHPVLVQGTRLSVFGLLHGRAGQPTRAN